MKWTTCLGETENQQYNNSKTHTHNSQWVIVYSLQSMSLHFYQPDTLGTFSLSVCASVTVWGGLGTS